MAAITTSAQTGGRYDANGEIDRLGAHYARVGTADEMASFHNAFSLVMEEPGASTKV